MRTINRVYTISLVILLSMAAYSCRSGKNAINPSDIQAVSQQWDEMTIPVKVDFKSPVNLSGSGTAYMRRGEDIMITLRVFGFEVANIYADSDSVYASDKINKRYIAEPISDLLAGSKLTIGDIQDLLTGRDAKLPREASYTYTDMGGLKVPETLTVKSHGKSVVCRYSDPSLTDHGLFMSKATVKSKIGKTDIDVTLTLNFSSAKWSIGKSIGWRQPKNYTRIDPLKLIKALSGK